MISNDIERLRTYLIELFSCILSLQALEKIHQRNAALCIDLCSRLLTSLEDKTNTLFIVEYLLQQLSSKIRAERIKQLRLLRLGCMVHIYRPHCVSKRRW